MRIRWTVPAAYDLENIKNYLERRHPRFSESTVRTICQRIRSLKTLSDRRGPGHRSGTRELALTALPYVCCLLSACVRLASFKESPGADYGFSS
jgi:plasmid stabilization system protein ParE